MSMRRILASGNIFWVSSATFWVPAPKKRMDELPQAGQVLGGLRVAPQ